MKVVELVSVISRVKPTDQLLFLAVSVASSGFHIKGRYMSVVLTNFDCKHANLLNLMEEMPRYCNEGSQKYLLNVFFARSIHSFCY